MDSVAKATESITGAVSGGGLDPPEWGKGGWRLAAGRQIAEQLGGGFGDLAHGSFEGVLGARRGGLDPPDLAHVLAGGGFDLLGGGGGLEASQRGDVAAHAPESTKDGAVRSRP
jgi:hypothetical protein